MKPKKSLGQNFLTSIPAKLAIVKAGEIEHGETILEIGPGKGALTEELLKTKAKVIAIEKDEELISFLNEKFSQEIKTGQLTLLNDDILKLETRNLKLETYKIIANIPYYITGAIIEKFLSTGKKPSQMVILIQKEVAERIVARDNKESILSIAVKVYGDPKIVYRVSRGSFHPIPNVDSAVLSIKNISQKNFKDEKHEEIFFKILKGGFAHKRKLLVSNLKEIDRVTDWVKIFNEENLNLKIRAEDMRLEDWLKLSAHVSVFNN